MLTLNNSKRKNIVCIELASVIQRRESGEGRRWIDSVWLDNIDSPLNEIGQIVLVGRKPGAQNTKGCVVCIEIRGSIRNRHESINDERKVAGNEVGQGRAWAEILACWSRWRQRSDGLLKNVMFYSIDTIFNEKDVTHKWMYIYVRKFLHIYPSRYTSNVKFSMYKNFVLYILIY